MISFFEAGQRYLESRYPCVMYTILAPDYLQGHVAIPEYACSFVLVRRGRVKKCDIIFRGIPDSFLRVRGLTIRAYDPVDLMKDYYRIFHRLPDASDPCFPTRLELMENKEHVSIDLEEIPGWEWCPK